MLDGFTSPCASGPCVSRPECISSNAAATGESMAILVDSGAPGFSANQRVSAVPSTRSITTYRAAAGRGALALPVHPRTLEDIEHAHNAGVAQAHQPVSVREPLLTGGVRAGAARVGRQHLDRDVFLPADPGQRADAAPDLPGVRRAAAGTDRGQQLVAVRIVGRADPERGVHRVPPASAAEPAQRRFRSVPAWCGHQYRQRGSRASPPSGMSLDRLHHISSSRGNSTAFVTSSRAAASGIATSAPIRPSIAPPITTATAVTMAGTRTARPMIGGTRM